MLILWKINLIFAKNVIILLKIARFVLIQPIVQNVRLIGYKKTEVVCNNAVKDE